METRTRIRINLNTREVEFEGSEEFIEKYDNIIQEFIEKLKTPDSIQSEKNTVLQPQTSMEESRPLSILDVQNLPDTFGEYYTKFPRNVRVIDKILFAAYYSQVKSEEGLFMPKDVSDLLTEQNVQITNASAFIKALVNAGKIFKHGGKFRISEKGVEQVLQLYNTPSI